MMTMYTLDDDGVHSEGPEQMPAVQQFVWRERASICFFDPPWNDEVSLSFYLQVRDRPLAEGHAAGLKSILAHPDGAAPEKDRRVPWQHVREGHAGAESLSVHGNALDFQAGLEALSRMRDVSKR